MSDFGGGIEVSFNDKTAIVTGGAQGIGMAVSTAFAKSGASVVIADIDEEAGMEHLEYIRSLGGRAIYVPTDAALEKSVKDLANRTVTEFGSIDIVINNAGIFDTKSLFDRTMMEWDRIISVNLRGPYMMAKFCGEELMKANPGVIINIASTRALMSEPNTEPYAAAKGGILSLTHSLAVSFGPKVRVNSISPGWIEVSDWKKSAKKVVPVHSREDELQHPAGRVGTPLDIAQACLFLADDSAGFITGTNLVIDGGMTIKMIYEE